MKREWKGAPMKQSTCGAELKIGMATPEAIRCELPRNHQGAHQSGTMSWNDMTVPARKDL